MTTLRSTTLALVAVLLVARGGTAQSLGTFTWRLEPFCNLVTVSITQNGAVYTMDGYDDLCGGERRAPLVGLATANPDGSIGLGWNMVVNGVGLQVGGLIALPGFSGPWSDSAGNSGHFVFGTATAGSPRPAPPLGSAIPNTFALLADGGFLARGTFGAGNIPAAGAGTRMMWHPAKAAFRAGSAAGAEWDDGNVGAFSTAFGFNTTALNAYSTAMGVGSRASGRGSTAFGEGTTASHNGTTAFGNGTTASGATSTAMGGGTTASGEYSTAMGHLTDAVGNTSTAMGYNTTASGPRSIAMGDSTTASGTNSTAIGLLATAAGPNSVAIGTSLSAAGQGSVVMGVRAAATAAANGSFVFGDRSTGQSGAVITSITPNEFLVRASGGVKLFTSTSLVSGLQLASGGSQWLGVSDVNMKHNFTELDGEDVLGKLARMSVMEWSYKSQDAAIRHVGPTAQDFNAAFNLGEDPLRIGTMDADGIALAGVKALEARTRGTNDALARHNEVLMREVADLRARLARLEALLDKR